MSPFLIRPALKVRGKAVLLGDKSIAHRSIIISSIAKGNTVIRNFPANKDCLYTLEAFKKLGIKILKQPDKIGLDSFKVSVFGKGFFGLRKPKSPIFVGDSGTTLRLILGVLSGQNFLVRLTAGVSLSRRPMLRVTEPLRRMGAEIKVKSQKSKVKSQKTKIEEYPPLTIKGGRLKAITYRMPVASAQVKSAILLAGLYAKGKVQVIEPISTRDHTERMLKAFGAPIKIKGKAVILEGGKELISVKNIYVPVDISSASFFMVLASLAPNSEILLKNVSLNPRRIGVVRVLKRMGAEIKVKSQKSKVKSYEPMGDIIVKSSKLRATLIKKEEIPSLIDEVPILMVAASLACGKTVFDGVSELRVKETDRINSMSENLRKMGAKIKIVKNRDSEKIIIQGISQLQGSCLRSFGDHRTAMSMVVAGLLAKGNSKIDDISCISKSFPNFFQVLRPLLR